MEEREKGREALPWDLRMDRAGERVEMLERVGKRKAGESGQEKAGERWTN